MVTGQVSETDFCPTNFRSLGPKTM